MVNKNIRFWSRRRSGNRFNLRPPSESTTAASRRCLAVSIGFLRTYRRFCLTCYVTTDRRPGAARQLRNGSPQIGLVHDVVSVENAPGFMTCAHHCHLLRDPRPDEIPNSRTPEVMRDAARTASGETRRLPRCPELRARRALRMHKGDAGRWNTHGAIGPATSLSFSAILFASSSSFFSSGISANGKVRPSSFFVDCGSKRPTPAPKSTLNRQTFARNAPTSEVRERRNAAQIRRQMPADGLELLALEEPRSDVVLLKHRNMRPVKQFAALNGDRKHPLQGGQLAVDLAVARLRVLTLGDKRTDARGRDAHHAAAAECRD